MKAAHGVRFLCFPAVLCTWTILLWGGLAVMGAPASEARTFHLKEVSAFELGREFMSGQRGRLPGTPCRK